MVTYNENQISLNDTRVWINVLKSPWPNTNQVNRAVARHPVSISEKTSYRKISWSLEAARFAFRSEIWQALRQHCCRCACQISKRYDNLKYQSRGFETSRDLTIRRLFGYWDGALAVDAGLLNCYRIMLSSDSSDDNSSKYIHVSYRDLTKIKGYI